MYYSAVLLVSVLVYSLNEHANLYTQRVVTVFSVCQNEDILDCFVAEWLYYGTFHRFFIRDIFKNLEFVSMPFRELSWVKL